MPVRSALATCALVLTTLLLGCSTPGLASLGAAQLLPGGEAVGGKLLFVREGNVWVWADGRARQLTDGGTWHQPRWSPDGTEIAYVYRATNFSEIFVMNADGSNSRRLTRSQSSSLDDNDWVFRPTWSPDGDQLAFVSDGNSYYPVLWLMRRDGSGKRQALAVSGLQEAADGLAWSPDGRRLAVSAFGEAASQILLVDLARGVAQAVTSNPNGALDPAWSPDGMVLAYAARDSGRMDVRLRRLDGSSEIEVSQGGPARAPAWSPDGGRLAYISARGGSFEIYLADVVGEGGRPSIRGGRQLTRDLNVDAVSGLSWSK